jgi:glycosyltransferase involved in cell wall biosynthesis
MIGGPTPRVSVVIPTWNRWPRILRTLGAALRQEEVDLEVIVVDDGSTDETATMLAGLDDPRLRVLRLPSRQGAARARNAGIAEASGEWVAFLDDDDLWHPRKLKVQLERAAATGASFVYGAAIHLREQNLVVNMPSAVLAHELKRRLLVANVMPAGSSNVIVKTELVRRLEGFDENLDHLADWDLWIRMAHAAPGAATRDVLVGYVHHADNKHKAAEDTVFAEYYYLVSKHRAASAAAEVEFDGALFTRALAHGHLRAGRRLHAARTFLRGALGHGDVGGVARAGATLLGESFMNRLGRDRQVPLEELDWLHRIWHEPDLGLPPTRSGSGAVAAGARRGAPQSQAESRS